MCKCKLLLVFALVILSSCSRKFESSEGFALLSKINNENKIKFERLKNADKEFYQVPFSKIYAMRELFSRKTFLFDKYLNGTKKIKIYDTTNDTNLGRVISYIYFDEDLVVYEFSIEKGTIDICNSCNFSKSRTSKEYFFVLITELEGDLINTFFP